jgi:hypothetical protein
VVGVCHVINCNAKAARSRQYLSVVLADEPGIFLWEHREFLNSHRVLLAKTACIVIPKGSIVFTAAIGALFCGH